MLPVIKWDVLQKPDLALNLGLGVGVGRKVKGSKPVVDDAGHDALEVSLYPTQGRVPPTPDLDLGLAVEDGHLPA